MDPVAARDLYPITRQYIEVDRVIEMLAPRAAVQP